MTVEHLTVEGVFENSEMKVLEFCEQHNDVLDALCAQRGIGESERNEVTSSMLVGVVHIMGPLVFEQHNGCPCCVLEGTLERAVDEVTIRRRKSN